MRREDDEELPDKLWFGRELGGGCEVKRREILMRLLHWRNQGHDSEQVSQTEHMCQSPYKWFCTVVLSVDPWVTLGWWVVCGECPLKMESVLLMEVWHPHWMTTEEVCILHDDCAGHSTVFRAPWFQPFYVLKSETKMQTSEKKKNRTSEMVVVEVDRQ